MRRTDPPRSASCRVPCNSGVERVRDLVDGREEQRRRRSGQQVAPARDAAVIDSPPRAVVLM